MEVFSINCPPLLHRTATDTGSADKCNTFSLKAVQSAHFFVENQLCRVEVGVRVERVERLLLLLDHPSAADRSLARVVELGADECSAFFFQLLTRDETNLLSTHQHTGTQSSRLHAGSVQCVHFPRLPPVGIFLVENFQNVSLNERKSEFLARQQRVVLRVIVDQGTHVTTELGNRFGEGGNDFEMND